MQNFFALYEALAVWGLNSDVAFGTEWLELASIGLRLLCGCIEAERLELVAMASAKLHNLIHSRDPSSTEEVCYLLNALNACVCESIKSKHARIFLRFHFVHFLTLTPCVFLVSSEQIRSRCASSVQLVTCCVEV